MQGLVEDQFKFRSIIFIVFVVSIIDATVGVFFVRNLYFVFTFICMIYTMIKFLQMVFILARVNIKYNQSIISYKKRQLTNEAPLKKVTHVFILPNFKESRQTLKQSILGLANHSRSKGYCLLLGMEAHQEYSQQKARQLVSQFSHIFRVMSFTVHTLQPNEYKCKSSNINWCARTMVPKLLEKGVSMDSVLVTIMDSDSHIPEAYIDQVQCKIEQDFQNRHKTIFQPPQIFTTNQAQATFCVRLVDTFMSYMHCSNLYSVFDYTLGVSNYTMSYRLLERIDFWDTCLYSKGEDIRIPSKAFWKTNGQTKTCPIYIPINQMSLSTNQGCWADFKARFRQAQRHSQDQTEVSYNFVNMLRSPIRFVLKFHVFFSICELYVMMVAVPVPFLVLLMQDVLKILPKSEFDDGNTFYLLNSANMIIMFIGYFLYDIFKARASKDLYGIKPLNILYSIQVPLFQVPVAIIFGFIPMILASFSMLTSNIIFTVAPKSSGVRSKNPESLFRPEELEITELIDQIQDET